MSLTYIDAIHQAQAELLRDDESVFLYGRFASRQDAPISGDRIVYRM